MRGASLLEVVVTVTLLAVVIPLLFSLFPSSLRALSHSEVLQEAVALATYRVDEAALVCRGPGLDLRERRSLEGRTFEVAREFYRLDEYRMDVTVSVTTAGEKPVVLHSRILYGL